MHRFGLILIVVSMSLASLFGQKFEKTSHNFGDVSFWKNSTAIFTCTNNTKGTIVFLPTFPKPDVQVEIVPNELKPGQKGKVMVTYYTSARGSFKKKVSIFTSNSGNPINLTVSGNIVSFDPDAVMECPTIKPKDDNERNNHIQEFQVIEAVTGEIIEGAFFSLTSNGKKITDEKSNDKGMISVRNLDGHYVIGVWKSGYESVTIPTHVGKYKGRILIELEPVVEEEPVLATTTTAPPPDNPPPPTVVNVTLVPKESPEEPEPTPDPIVEAIYEPTPNPVEETVYVPVEEPVDDASVETNTTAVVTVVTTTTTTTIDGEVVTEETSVVRKADTTSNTVVTEAPRTNRPPIVVPDPDVPVYTPEEPVDVPRVRIDNSHIQVYKVVDKVSQEPIQGASFSITKYSELVTQSYTDDLGYSSSEILSGQYRLEVSKPGYETEQLSKYLSSSRGVIIIELESLTKTDPVVANVPTTPVYEDEPIIYEDEPITYNEEPIVYEDEPEVIDEGHTTPREVEDVVVITEQQPVVTPIDIDPTLDPTIFSPNNIVFLIDASKSMNTPDKLPLLKKSISELLGVLRDIDYITIIAYNKRPWVVLPTTAARDKEGILFTVDSLMGKDWTNGVKGLESAYQTIKDNYIVGGNNQIILSTDGLFNSANSDDTDGLYKLVRKEAQDGITLSVVGFGDEAGAKRLMRKLAVNGQGSFIQFDHVGAASALIEEIKLQSGK